MFIGTKTINDDIFSSKTDVTVILVKDFWIYTESIDECEIEFILNFIDNMYYCSV